jgi:hypothetical protein
LGLDLDAAFWAWTWKRLFRLDFDACFWSSTWTRLFLDKEKRVFSIPGDWNFVKNTLRTGKDVGRNVSNFLVCLKHVSLVAFESTDLTSLTWTRLLGPGLVRGILAWTCTRFFGLNLDAAFFPGLGRGFLFFDLDAALWFWTWTRFFGPGLGRVFWAWC